MLNGLKIFLYIIACFLIFLSVTKFYKTSVFLDSDKEIANTFPYQKEVFVYFGNKNMGSEEDCSLVFPVSRKIINAESLGIGALESLLSGPTQTEKDLGYFNSINSGVMFGKFEIIDFVAYVDFHPDFNEGVAGSCRVESIKSQIENTLVSLPDIDKVIISVDGETEGILEP